MFTRPIDVSRVIWLALTYEEPTTWDQLVELAMEYGQRFDISRNDIEAAAALTLRQMAEQGIAANRKEH